MSLPPTDDVPDKVSKVTFSPVSDSKGNDAMIVTIKSVAPNPGEIPKIQEPPRRFSAGEIKSTSVDPRRKTRSRLTADKSSNKSTMTESSSVKSSSASQTSLSAVTETSSGSTPCLKHAALNISRKASNIPSEKVSLCNDCSKSMLSYIFVVQDFLDSLAKEICGPENAESCVQCLREETRRLAIERDDASTPNASTRPTESSKHHEKHKESNTKHERRSNRRSSHSKETTREVRRYEETAEQLIQRSILQHSQSQQQDNPYWASPSDNNQADQPTPGGHCSNVGGQNSSAFPSQQSRGNAQNDTHDSQIGSSDLQTHDQYHPRSQNPSGNQPLNQADSKSQHQDQLSPFESSLQPSFNEHVHVPSSNEDGGQQPQENIPFRESFHHGYQPVAANQAQHSNNHQPLENVSSPFSAEVDGIVSTLSNTEREVYDAARNGAGWEGLSEWQERLISSSSSPIASEAYVTMCRNNAEALGCLVVGSSLLLSRTNRTLCVLVSEGVSNAFRAPLSSVFHVVQCVRAMDPLATTKLALLEQPELGVSFEKLHAWRLVQFNKCVFLNYDTVVLQNCDELFCRDELSAVPDIGWPDCFNSGVFVFVPSIQTFWQLLEFAEKQGSYDGGDQGLLNSYFSSWSDDINKKLSFIYNLMANVSYTYTPAFKQFGRNVKIVQFHGTFKPWHVKFFSHTGQISPETSVHPTYVQFVHVWLNIFRISALRQFSQEIQAYALAQKVICAVELLRFFPLPTESEADFYLTPPSVRLRLTERRLQKTRMSSSTSDAQRRKSAEFPRSSVVQDELESPPKSITPEASPEIVRGDSVTDDSVFQSGSGDTKSDSVKTPPVPEKNTIPGAEVGNYQGMKAWEQGRMDYQGSDGSDTIIKRLQFLMSQPK